MNTTLQTEIQESEEQAAISQVGLRTDPREAERQRVVEAIFERSRRSPWARQAARELDDDGNILVRVAAFLGGETDTKAVERKRRVLRGTYKGNGRTPRFESLTAETILEACRAQKTKTATARALDMSRKTLDERIQVLGIVGEVAAIIAPRTKNGPDRGTPSSVEHKTVFAARSHDEG